MKKLGFGKKKTVNGKTFIFIGLQIRHRFPTLSISSLLLCCKLLSVSPFLLFLRRDGFHVLMNVFFNGRLDRLNYWSLQAESPRTVEVLPFLHNPRFLLQDKRKKKKKRSKNWIPLKLNYLEVFVPTVLKIKVHLYFICKKLQSYIWKATRKYIL